MTTADDSVCRALADEEDIQYRTDEQGKKWRKAYFGGGAHFENWLKQYREVFGTDRVITEEADSGGLRCYEGSREKMYRIWVREE